MILLKPKDKEGRKELTPYQQGRMRKKLWNERDHVCHLCDLPINSIHDMELDHIEPQPKNCIKDWNEENLAIAHVICNRIKGSIRDLEDVRAKCRGNQAELLW